MENKINPVVHIIKIVKIIKTHRSNFEIKKTFRTWNLTDQESVILNCRKPVTPTSQLFAELNITLFQGVILLLCSNYGTTIVTPFLLRMHEDQKEYLCCIK